MTRTNKITIPDREVAGSLKAIRTQGPFAPPKDRNYRDIENDIAVFNEMARSGETVGGILSQSCFFLHRKFGYLETSEIFMRKRKGEKPELIAKAGCSCRNAVTAPLGALVDGSLTDCGCRTPLPQTYSDGITVFQSEAPTRWTTTVDGIQWFGNRYLWFVTLFVRSACVLREFEADTRTALRLRRDAERRYYGRSVIDRYEDAMLFELEQYRLAYIAKHPPRVEGIYLIGNRWNTRLRHRNKLVFNKSFGMREEAVKARLGAERKYYGTPIMAEKYYV